MEGQSGFDFNTTLRWVSGVLQDPNGTARAYQETGANWQGTFIQITLPVYVLTAVVGLVLAWLFGRGFMFGVGGGPFYLVMMLLWSLALFFVAVFIFGFFGGVFQGQRNFSAAFAALSLAAVPSLAGRMVSPLPWIGWLIGIAAGIYSLVLFYRFIPIFMTVPEDKRVVHFVVSVVATFVVNMIVGGVLAAGLGAGMYQHMGATGVGDDAGTSGASGVFGDFERQADFAEQASKDTYDPPSNGMLTDAQVAAYARSLQRTAELRDRLGKKFENKGDDESPSVGDIFSGVKSAVRMGTAEMEVVKTGGGNWAEHQWVRNQLETARIQQDSSPAVKHNYALFQKYQSQIEKYE